MTLRIVTLLVYKLTGSLGARVGGASNSVGLTVAILYCYHILSLKLQYFLASPAQTHKDHKILRGTLRKKRFAALGILYIKEMRILC